MSSGQLNNQSTMKQPRYYHSPIEHYRLKKCNESLIKFKYYLLRLFLNFFQLFVPFSFLLIEHLKRAFQFDVEEQLNFVYKNLQHIKFLLRRIIIICNGCHYLWDILIWILLLTLHGGIFVQGNDGMKMTMKIEILTIYAQ